MSFVDLVDSSDDEEGVGKIQILPFPKSRIVTAPASRQAPHGTSTASMNSSYIEAPAPPQFSGGKLDRLDTFLAAQEVDPLYRDTLQKLKAEQDWRTHQAEVEAYRARLQQQQQQQQQQQLQQLLQNSGGAQGSYHGGAFRSHDSHLHAMGPGTALGVVASVAASSYGYAPAPMLHGLLPSASAPYRRALPSSLTGIAPPPSAASAAAGPTAPYVPMAHLSFSLVNLQQFTVRASEGGRIDDRLLPAMQSVPGFTFEQKRNRIVFPLSSHQQLVSAITTSARMHLLESLPAAIITAAYLRSEKEARQSNAEMARHDAEIEEILLKKYHIPSQIMEALAPFQREAVHFVCNPATNNGRALIADEMGLGKTRSAIGCICAYANEWPVLIVVPSSAKNHWRTELLALTSTVLGNDGEPLLPPQLLTVVEAGSHPIGSSERHRKYKVVIISYALVDNMYDALRSMNFGVLVLDESHYLKSGKTKRTKALLPFARDCQRTVLLSGTPALSRPMELWSQLNMLAPTRWNDPKEFGRRYCRKKSHKGVKQQSMRVVISLEASSPRDGGSGGGGGVNPAGTIVEVPKTAGGGVGGGSSSSSRQSEFSGASNTHELHLLLTDSIMIRRMKKHVLRALPPKQRSLVKVPVIDDDVREELRGLLSDVRRLEEDQQQRKRQRQRQRPSRGAGRGGHVDDDDDNDNDDGGAGAGAGTGGSLTRNLGNTRNGEREPEAEADEEAEADGESEGEFDEKQREQQQKAKRVSHLMKLFAGTGAAKLPAVLVHLGCFLDDPASGKLLIFAHHRSVIMGLSSYLDARQQQYIRIDGRIPASERGALVNTFQNDPRTRVAVLAITAAGVAITLTAAATVFFAEMFWTPGSLIQAEDRAHRIGQTRAVQIKYFYAEDTADDLLWPLVKNKMKALGEIVEGQAADMHANSSTSSSRSSSSSSSRSGSTDSASGSGSGSGSGGLGDMDAPTRRPASSSSSASSGGAARATTGPGLGLEQSLAREMALYERELKAAQHQQQQQQSSSRTKATAAKKRAKARNDDDDGEEEDEDDDEEEEEEEETEVEPEEEEVALQEDAIGSGSGSGSGSGDADLEPVEQAEPCPLVERYAREQRILRRRRDHAVVLDDKSSPYVPREQKPLEGLRIKLEGPSELDLLLMQSGNGNGNGNGNPSSSAASSSSLSSSLPPLQGIPPPRHRASAAAAAYPAYPAYPAYTPAAEAEVEAPSPFLASLHEATRITGAGSSSSSYNHGDADDYGQSLAGAGAGSAELLLLSHSPPSQPLGLGPAAKRRNIEVIDLVDSESD